MIYINILCIDIIHIDVIYIDTFKNFAMLEYI